ncbi:TDP-N-acetylfucosamine:lipid II N-acetylfucosaminyltransferase [Salinisphaera sp. S4-8]|uniref:TDP-N-acetylfucosamine:lipid II N-acetylfucosaminyltransferase n=1 Tax=Salinisphaera sp. S4-8 TaxID=633357 RepID=UPI003340809C
MAKYIRNLHICPSEKFIPSYIEFVRKYFEADGNHFAIIAGKSESAFFYTPGTDVRKYTSTAQVAQLVYDIWRSDKVIVHGLLDPNVVKLLAAQPWAHKKTYWVIWGADLYAYARRKRNFRQAANERIKAYLIRRIYGLLTYIPGDVELARKWYGATGTHFDCFMYLSNIYRPRSAVRKGSDVINIQLGNSAAPTNNHIEVLHQLGKYRDENINILTPLSYGNRLYAENVINVGKRIFGEKFVAITDFMSGNDYSDFLGSIDIAIFNHDRQQAMGNTITLLGMGKTVFMRRDITPWQLFSSLGITLGDVEYFELKKFRPEVTEENSRRIAAYFSEERLVDQYARILR